MHRSRTSRRPTSRWLSLLVVLALLATACGGDGEESPDDGDATPTETSTDTADDREIQEGGSVTFGADQEPAILNEWLTEGNLAATSNITKAIMYPLWRITPDFAYEPLLLDGEPEVSEDPFTVTYTLKDEANWSDGEPIVADDILFTLQTCMDEAFDITSRQGCDKVDFETTEIVDEKTIRVAFTEPYAPWRTLISVQPLLPRHILEGEDFNTVWNDALPIASGPFQFEEWQKGQQLTITRNDNFWGEMANLDRVVFRFIEDSNSQVQALRGGEIDMFYPQPQLELVEQVNALEGVESEAGAGPIWEHLDFNLAVPPMDQLYVRQAMALGIDREAIVRELIVPLQPEAEVLQNVIYVVNQEEYEPHFEVNYDPDAAIALLEENGCTRGDDQIFTCEGTRMSFEYVTTAGNELRELQLEIVQAQLSEIGVEVIPNAQDAATAFGTTLVAGPEGAWGLFNFAWVGSPDPAGGNTTWVCGGDLNYNSYCNQEVTDLIEQTNQALDPAERADLYNEADAIMATELPVLPLYQKPTFFAWSEDIAGPRDNATQWGPTWNIEEWGLVG